MWKLFKVNNIGKEMSSMTSLCCFYREVWKDFAHSLGVSIVDFEQMSCFITVSVESKIIFSLKVFEKLLRKNQLYMPGLPPQKLVNQVWGGKEPNKKIHTQSHQ